MLQDQLTPSAIVCEQPSDQAPTSPLIGKGDNTTWLLASTTLLDRVSSRGFPQAGLCEILKPFFVKLTARLH